MYDNIVRPCGLEARFGFLAPNTVNSGLIVTRPNDVIAYVLDLFVASKDTEKFFFFPYNTGNGLDFHPNLIYYNFLFFGHCLIFV